MPNMCVHERPQSSPEQSDDRPPRPADCRNRTTSEVAELGIVMSYTLAFSLRRSKSWSTCCRNCVEEAVGFEAPFRCDVVAPLSVTEELRGGIRSETVLFCTFSVRKEYCLTGILSVLRAKNSVSFWMLFESFNSNICQYQERINIKFLDNCTNL